PAKRQSRAELLRGSIYTHSCRVLRKSKSCANLRQRFLFKITEHQGVTIGGFEFTNGFIQDRPSLVPIRVGVRGNGVHRQGGLFAEAAAVFGAHDFCGCKSSARVQPTAQSEQSL